MPLVCRRRQKPGAVATSITFIPVLLGVVVFVLILDTCRLVCFCIILQVLSSVRSLSISPSLCLSPSLEISPLAEATSSSFSLTSFQVISLSPLPPLSLSLSLLLALSLCLSLSLSLLCSPSWRTPFNKKDHHCDMSNSPQTQAGTSFCARFISLHLVLAYTHIFTCVRMSTGKQAQPPTTKKPSGSPDA